MSAKPWLPPAPRGPQSAGQDDWWVEVTSAGAAGAQRDQLVAWAGCWALQTASWAPPWGPIPVCRELAGRCGVPGDQSSVGVASGRRWWTITASCLQRRPGGSRRRCGRPRGADWRAPGFVSSRRTRSVCRCHRGLGGQRVLWALGTWDPLKLHVTYMPSSGL